MKAPQTKTLKSCRQSVLLALTALLIIAVSALADSSTIPRQVILTWQNDPTETMTITWRTDVPIEQPTLLYAGSARNLEESPKQRNAESFTFEQTDAWLHTVELTDLSPGEDYHVIIQHSSEPDKFTFRTAPDQHAREIVFLAGGDSRSQRDVRRQVNALAAQHNPEFVIFTGDMINRALSEQEWDDWFDDWHEQMITDYGRRIPIIPAIGNHEVDGGLDPANAPFYYNRFITPEPRSYYVIDYGPGLSVITLDSSHTTPIENQNDWLKQTLEARSDIPWRLVQYHVAAWPSVRDFDGHAQRFIRNNWVPIFEEFNVPVVIEAHDHAYKQTVPIRDGREDPNGVIYTGDGGWGAPLRQVKNSDDYWWLKEAKPADHFWKFTVSEDASQLRAEPIFLKDYQATPFTLQN